MYTPRFVYSFICGWTRVAIEHLFMCLLLFDCLLWRSEMKVAQLCPTLCNPVDCPWNSPGQNTGVDSLFLLQGIFPTQGSKPGLPHCRRILYQLSYQGSPFFGESSFQILCLFFKLGFCCCWLVGILFIFLYITSYHINDLRILSLILCVAFSILLIVLVNMSFNFDVVEFLYFIFCCLSSRIVILDHSFW